MAFRRETFLWRQRWVFFAGAFGRETFSCRQRWGVFAAEFFICGAHEVKRDFSVFAVVVVGVKAHFKKR